MDNFLKPSFQKLYDWYLANQRDLPFRKTRDPYKILVSEVMSQQTQIETLLPYYERFIKRFPTIEDLANSPIEEVYKYWEGLGYYNRAKNLLKAAKIIVKDGFPKKYDDLIKLPGIGSYTAGAISSICFNERKAAVDGNTLRVITRLLALETDISKAKTKNTIAGIIEENTVEDAGKLNQAIMDLASSICLPKQPKCLLCPIREFCLSYKNGLTTIIPVKKSKLKRKTIENEALIIIDNKKVLYSKRNNQNLLNNTYGIPLVEKGETKGQAVKTLAERFRVSLPTYIGSTKHAFSHLQWKTDVYLSYANDKSNIQNLTDNPPIVPTAFKKMIEIYKTNSFEKYK